MNFRLFSCPLGASTLFNERVVWRGNASASLGMTGVEAGWAKGGDFVAILANQHGCVSYFLAWDL
ncbi:MAG: hypothetical protein LBU91_00965 [Bacteroidales bacterium]|nr:hypothetical protein [Bacteroidales bacterium]